MKIAIAGTGYVGLSNAMLLAQHHEVVAVDIIEQKISQLNDKISPKADVEIEDFLANKPLNFTTTLDKHAAYTNDEIDISRGDAIVKSNNPDTTSELFEAILVSMDETAVQPDKDYEFKVGTKITLQNVAVNGLLLNKIYSYNIHRSSPVVIDEYNSVHGTGSFIVIDKLANVTVGGGYDCREINSSNNKNESV
ncbi:hypothetical protein [Shewanella metallivivens]|uniref:hypothetical protein n=1 Tax=Shewanella metallivivens TaxID=2872342 RepID=UPI0034A59FF2